MPKGQAPDPKMKGLTLASLRSEASALEAKGERQDEKLRGSLIRRLVRKVRGASGVSAAARRSLISRLDKISETTMQEPTKDPVGKPVRRNKDGSMYP